MLHDINKGDEAMRKFRSDGVNLRDVRIVYVLLLFLAVLCAVMGAALKYFSGNAKETGLSGARMALEGCYDSLLQWETAQDSEGRYKAAVRFETVSCGLPSDVKLELLSELAVGLKDGTADKNKVRALAETFGNLAASDYGSAFEASINISKAVNEALGVSHEQAESELSAEAEIPNEVLAYTEKVVKKSIREIFDGNEGTIKPTLSESKDKWTVSADNVRMSFDAENGRMEEFVIIRLGQSPGDAADIEKRLEAVRDFYTANRRCERVISVEPEREICGFLSVLVNDTDGSYRVSVDPHCRIWSLTKVKR